MSDRIGRLRTGSSIPRPSVRAGLGNRRLFTAVAIGTVLVAGACSSTSSDSNTDSTAGSEPSVPATTAGTTPPTGEDVVAIPPVDQAALQAALDTAVGELLAPGAVVLVKTPDGTFAATYGTTEYEGGRPVTVDDHFRIGSVTKSWTGTVILQMVQEGKLSLEDPVSKYRSDVPNGENITIEQLLSMRAGLANYSTDPQLNAVQDSDPQKAWRQDELLAIAYAAGPFAPPGETFFYSNTNTVLLGLIAEQLDAKPLATIFQDRLLTPLGMDESSFPDITSSASAEPHADGYMFGTNVSTIETAELPPDELAAAVAGTLLPNNYTDLNPSWAWSAGAGISTAGDLATLVEAMTGDHGSVLDASMTAKRLDSVQPILADHPEIGYGWALARFGPMYGHTGELPGYNTFMGNDPVNHVTLVVWANLAPDPSGVPPATTIAQSLIPFIYGGGDQASVGAEDPTSGTAP